MCQSNIKKQWLGNKWLYSFIPHEWLWKRQPTGYLKYRFRGLPLSGSSRKPHQSLGRNHIHYSFPYTELGTHNPHLWAQHACLCVCMSMCWGIVISAAMSLWLSIYADVHVSDHMLICTWSVYIWCGCMGEEAGCVRGYLIFMGAAAAVCSSEGDPRGASWSHCLSGPSWASGSQLNTKHLHTRHSAAPMLTSQHCFTHSWKI